MKTYETGEVLSVREISHDIFDMEIATTLRNEAKAGQFVMIYPHDSKTLLPRPISICEITNRGLRFVYRIAGAGPREFSTWKEGDKVRLLGPVGNGFPIEEAVGKDVVVMGGGIGVPPILELSKNLSGKAKTVTAVLGYRNSDLFLKEDFDRVVSTEIATEDGSVGVKGNVLTLMEEKKLKADVIMACGPMPMLRAIKAYAEKEGIVAYISLEERMACGVGACLGCVCKTVKKDGHSHVNNARVCTEGPVFDAREVEI